MKIETDLGILSLTPNQSGRLITLHGALIISFSSRDDRYSVRTVRVITPSEKAQIISDMLALSNDPLDAEQDKLDFASHTLKGKTPAEAAHWIEDNVTDLASAKAAMKKMAPVLIYLLRRSDLGG